MGERKRAPFVGQEIQLLLDTGAVTWSDPACQSYYEVFLLMRGLGASLNEASTLILARSGLDMPRDMGHFLAEFARRIPLPGGAVGTSAAPQQNPNNAGDGKKWVKVG